MSATATFPIEITDKNQWPNLVGKPGQEVIEQLRIAHPEFSFQLVEEGMAVTMDYRLDRVRIFLDKEGRISSPPRAG